MELNRAVLFMVAILTCPLVVGAYNNRGRLLRDDVDDSELPIGRRQATADYDVMMVSTRNRNQLDALCPQCQKHEIRVTGPGIYTLVFDDQQSSNAGIVIIVRPTPGAGPDKENIDGCSLNYTECMRGGTVKCIPNNWICDTDVDCDDGSDEDAQMCSERQCGPDEAKCASGQCVDANRFCNNWGICRSSDYFSDYATNERTRSIRCNTIRPCSRSDVLCDNGQCIAEESYCDGLVTCEDGSYRNRSNCYFWNCDEGQVRCPGYTRCVSRLSFCDGENDCPDGFDEQPTTCGAMPCLETELRCASGQCVNKIGLCLGSSGVKCADNSITRDSHQCSSVHCKAGDFMCRGERMCVNRVETCNGFNTCSDGSDEDPELCENVQPQPSTGEPCEQRAHRITWFCEKEARKFFNNRSDMSAWLHLVLRRDSRQTCAFADRMFRCFHRSYSAVCSSEEMSRYETYFMYARTAIEYICSDHFQEFDENKACLLEKDQNGDRLIVTLGDACYERGRPSGGPNCIERDFYRCMTDRLTQRCGAKFVKVLEPLARQYMQAVNITFCSSSQPQHRPRSHENPEQRSFGYDFLKRALDDFI